MSGVVIELHPKFVDRWARRYITIYTTDGAVFAKRWAAAFLNESAQSAMSTRVKEILGNK